MVDPVNVVAVLGSFGTFAGIATTVYYHRQTRRITWADLRDEAEALQTEIEARYDPEVVVTPGLRGATVANLMRGVYESVLLYTGVREDVRRDSGLPHRPTNYVALPETTKYRHYVPEALLEETDRRVLLLDAFTDTGQTLLTFEAFLLDHGFPEDHVRRATVTCSERAIDDGTEPHFYSLEVSRPFYFPWGKAV